MNNKSTDKALQLQRLVCYFVYRLQQKFSQDRVHMIIVKCLLSDIDTFVLLQIDPDYTEETYSISNYPLSAALTCAKLCTAFEEKWGVV